MPFELSGKYYTPKEVATAIGKPYERITSLLDSWGIEPLTVGSQRLISEADYQRIKTGKLHHGGILYTQTQAAIELGISAYMLSRGVSLGLPLVKKGIVARISGETIKQIKKSPHFHKGKPDWPKLIAELKTQEEEKA